ncbi:bifunctional GTP diphosphokinase/guanosine-3',5'-bis(diphosphate) 3'-diphosphatase [Pasteurellaceae bacterium RH1A]|nr:bifunctional GTP diphosphokinase/guanosine-3',5'-bis(diphosphate) 3'-diphosphatase [Pasteurellaceae bacterium RH1A]
MYRSEIFEPLNCLIQGYLPQASIAQVKAAFELARDAHEGQFRSSGEPYITHPVAVACIIAELKLDHEAVMAALLHDVIEDTPCTEEELTEKFGASVAEIVQGVSKLDKLKFRTRQEAQVENFRKMILAMTKDIRVVLIKLADRTHNMQTLGALRPDKRQRIAKETLEIYSPLAHRLGIESMKNELEDLCLKAMHPYRFQVMKNAVEMARQHKLELIEKISEAMQTRLKEAGIKSRIFGREKNLYYLYQKTRSKELNFQSILDIFAFRVVVDSLDECYRVLGLLHALYKPRPQMVKDYIAVPKANGYQSLQTSLIGPKGVPVEVHICTEDMHLMAEYGVVAHWRYSDNQAQATSVQRKAQQWLNSIIELQQSAGNSQEFIESVKSELFSNNIYVFTPKGRIIELPAQATAIDFAYAVHSDVGDRCVGAVVDRHPYPLSQPLASGQTIEVITKQGQRPTAAWLNYVVSAKAKACIRQRLKHLQRDEAIALGSRQLLLAMNLQDLAQIDPLAVELTLSELKLEQLDDLLAEIGLGHQVSGVIAARLLGKPVDISPVQAPASQAISVQSAHSDVMSLAKCCMPIPGDEIIARLNTGRGLIVHRVTCPNVKGFATQPNNFTPVTWDVAADQAEFEVELIIEMQHQAGVLAGITQLLSNMNSNILNIYSEPKDDSVHLLLLSICVRDKAMLDLILNRLASLHGVVQVVRK